MGVKANRYGKGLKDIELMKKKLPHYYHRVLVLCVAVMMASGALFPVAAEATNSSVSDIVVATSSLVQSVGLTEEKIKELMRAPTMEERMNELQPPENKIDLRAAKPQKILKTIALPHATTTAAGAGVTKKSRGGVNASELQALSAAAETDTGNGILDAGFNFLRSTQTANGSWMRFGEQSAVTDTVAVLDAFTMLGVASNTAYTTGIGWLGSQFPDSTLLAAQKFWMLARSGQDVSYSFDAIVQRSNDNDGGFGYDRKYRSDVMTGAAMLEAITASNYTGDGDNPDYIKIAAILFLLNNQNVNGGWGEFIGDQSRALQTTAALGALFSYRTAVVSGPSGDSAIKDYVARGLAYLANTQAADGTWNASVADTARAYETLHRYGAALSYEDAAFEYLKAAQAADGSFGGQNPYATALALKALSYRLFDKRPDLVITDITTSSALVNYRSASFTVTVKNIGSGTITRGRLYDFTGDYNWNPAGYDLGALGMNLAPGDAFTLTFNYPATGQFLGPMEFKFYAEGEGELNYDNNWKSKVFAFAGESSGKPALPVYFIAHKYDIDGMPALNVRWSKRDDPNRAAYAIMYRKKGASAWDFSFISNAWNGAFLWPFEEGATYEITAGVVHQDWSTVTFSENIVDITMSANPLAYTGQVSGRITFNEKPFANESMFGYGIPGSTDQNGNFTASNVANGTTAAWASNTVMNQKSQFDRIVTKFPVPIGGITSGIRIFTRLADDTEPPQITYLEVQGALQNNSGYWVPNGFTKNLLIEVRDNKAWKEADFWYFEPKISEWVYIKTATSTGSSFVLSPWKIGADLLGTGYKIRAVARDWRGNSSAPVEWGPFEIKKGVNIPPTIRITEPDGINDNADATSTIAWDDSDPDSNAAISLFYDADKTGANGTLITSGISEDSAINSYVWDTSAVPTGTYYIYGVIDDGAATALSYSTGSTTIAHAPILIPPGPPINLAGISMHQTKARLTWDTPLTEGDRPLTGYRIERKLASESSFTVIVPDTATTTRLFVDTDLTPSMLYEYRLRALSSAGQSASTSNIAHVRTLDPVIAITSRIKIMKDVGIVLSSDKSRYVLAANSTFYSLAFQGATFSFDVRDGASITLISPDKREFKNSLNVSTVCEANRSLLVLTLLPNASIPQIGVTPSGTCSDI